LHTDYLVTAVISRNQISFHTPRVDDNIKLAITPTIQLTSYRFLAKKIPLVYKSEFLIRSLSIR